ncbi:MAG TPA: glycine dehydrogenase subunit 2 [Spirochaetia bacterium]|nr:glycine dehydrogenase subunit 2 [Spirochaetia bacterium]
MKLLFEESKPGRTSVIFPELDVAAAPSLPGPFRRRVLPLPDLTESQVIRHYTELSRRNLGVDNAFYPLGSCTMKYNPRIHETAVRHPAFRDAHPLLPEKMTQGSLKLMHRLQTALAVLTGMDAVTCAPAAGAHGELAGLMMIKAWFAFRGEERDEILAPDSSHGTNPASAAMCGFKLVTVKSGSDGRLDCEDLKPHITPRTAGLMLTNPNTLGIFEHNIVDISDLIHAAGGLLYGDGANANAVLGHALFSAMGYDIVHLNLHKTFATPHGGGGPGAGPLAVREHLAPFLPAPVVIKEGDHYRLTRPSQSIGRIRTFAGNFGVLVRAYAYISSLGQSGLAQASETAVLNAAYLKARLKDHFHLQYATPTLHEFVIDDSGIPNGVTAMDIAKRLLDYGFHPPTIAFPLIVRGALMIEPTETETKETLDAFADALIAIKKEAAQTPQLVKTAPHTTPVKRLDEVLAARRPDLAYPWKPD